MMMPLALVDRGPRGQGVAQTRDLGAQVFEGDYRLVDNGCRVGHAFPQFAEGGEDLVGGCGFRSGPAVSSRAGCVLGRSRSERTAVDAPRDVARDKLDPRTTPQAAPLWSQRSAYFGGTPPRENERLAGGAPPATGVNNGVKRTTRAPPHPPGSGS